MDIKWLSLGLLTITEKRRRSACDEEDVGALSYLTSAEEYPDDEYLDMSKSSSLKQTNKKDKLFICVYSVYVARIFIHVYICCYLSVSRATKGFSSGLWSKEE